MFVAAMNEKIISSGCTNDIEHDTNTELLSSLISIVSKYPHSILVGDQRCETIASAREIKTSVSC